jgi:hypothetical protein
VGGQGDRRGVLPDSAPVLCPPTSAPPVMDPLEAFCEGLALARRAGMPWQQAQYPAREAALLVAPSDDERDEWEVVLYDTRTAWMRAYERRPTGCAL